MIESDRKLMRDTYDAIMSVKIDVGGMKIMVDAHNKTLYGNGQKGLKDLMTEMTVTQRDCPARLAKTPSVRSNILTLCAVVIAGIALLRSLLP
jgi:hypothetical protein